MKINTRQAGVLLAIMLFANKILILPSLLAENSKADGLFVLMGLFLIDFLGCICFLCVKKRYQTESLFEILSTHVGKVITYIIFLLLLFYFFIKFCLLFNITHGYFKAQVYQDEKIYIFLFTSIIVIWSFIKGGVQSLGRTAEFLFIPIILGIIFCVFISFTNFNNLPYFFDTKINILAESGFKYIFHFGDFLFLFLIMDKIEYSKKISRDILKISGIIMLLISVGEFLYFSIFQNTSFMHTNAISDLIVLSYRIFDIGRLDIIAVITVMSLTFLQLGLYGYLCVKIMTTIMPNLSQTIASIFLGILFIISYFSVFNSYDLTMNFIKIIMPYFAIFLQYILPCFCLFLRKRQ